MEISTVGVIGAGTMGSGLAQNLADVGYNVVLSVAHKNGRRRVAGAQERERFLQLRLSLLVGPPTVRRTSLSFSFLCLIIL